MSTSTNVSNTVTNATGRALSQPVGIISDFLDVNSNVIQEIRDRVSSSGLLATIQGKMLLNTPEQIILKYLNDDKAPIPAPSDREGYHGENHIQYWIMGLADAIYLNHTIEKYLNKSVDEPVTILDFGCSSGRVIRHLAGSRPNSKLLGCDLNSKSISFIRGYLPKNVMAFHNVSYPPLPIEDNSVDFIYALSIFTHISDFEEAWLFELRRILKPGGMAFLTVHTERTWRTMNPNWNLIKNTLERRHSATGLDYFIPLVDESFFTRDSFGDRLVLTWLDYSINNTNVFHSKKYLYETWGQLFNIVDILESVHGPHQDGVLCIKA